MPAGTSLSGLADKSVEGEASLTVLIQNEVPEPGAAPLVLGALSHVLRLLVDRGTALPGWHANRNAGGHIGQIAEQRVGTMPHGR